jgi:UDP-N-acetylmuramate dehydrogenase
MIKQNISIKEYNTFGIECQAKHFVKLKSVDDFAPLIDFLKKEKIKTLVIGEGSNILFQNPYFDGIVIVNRLKGIDILEEDRESVVVEVMGGEIWDDFVKYCVDNEYYGVENLSLIPGTVGAAPVQNIGAYGVEVRDCVEEVLAINLETGNPEILTKEECRFDYRTSIFKTDFPDKYLIRSVTFRLSKIKKLVLNYGKLNESLSADSSLEEVRNKIIDIRESKLPDTKVLGNAGSFFKNPIIPIEKLNLLLRKHPKIVHYPTETNEERKLAAGWLIDQAGWKGKRKGEVGVHKEQALVIVNHGNATGQEIIDFSKEIINDIFDKFGVLLEREVRIY